jgi:hypothetical protein
MVMAAVSFCGPGPFARTPGAITIGDRTPPPHGRSGCGNCRNDRDAICASRPELLTTRGARPEHGISITMPSQILILSALPVEQARA